MSGRVRLLQGGEVDGDLAVVVDTLRRACHVVALTGAGISVESGIPDFRSPGGLWEVFDPMEYATLSCFLERPDKAWQLFRALGESIHDKQPNAAHRALADLEQAGRLAAIITQNVDGLHHAAGSRSVIEIHGEASRLQCLYCGRREPLQPRHLEPGPVPRCSHCGHPQKPDVVLFEEPVRHTDEIHEQLDVTDVLMVIGTSAQVVPASQFPHHVQGRGGTVLEFNTEPTLLTSHLSPTGCLIQGPASRTLTLVAQRVLVEEPQ